MEMCSDGMESTDKQMEWRTELIFDFSIGLA